MDYSSFYQAPIQAAGYHPFVDVPAHQFPVSRIDNDTTLETAADPHNTPPFYSAPFGTFQFNSPATMPAAGLGLSHPSSTPPPPLRRERLSRTPGPADMATQAPSVIADGSEGDATVRRRSRDNSEEKEASLTPAQSRRKAQNRAAQRAFRERKERHVRDLEAKLSELQSASHTLQHDNERLKLALHQARTQNKILIQQSGGQNPSVPSGSPDDLIDPTFPDMGADEDASGPGRTSTKTMPQKLLHASAAWALIQKHPLVSSGRVDISEVWEKLKTQAQCSGTGPAWDEPDIIRAVEEGRRGGGDELI